MIFINSSDVDHVLYFLEAMQATARRLHERNDEETLAIFQEGIQRISHMIMDFFNQHSLQCQMISFFSMMGYCTDGFVFTNSKNEKIHWIKAVEMWHKHMAKLDHESQDPAYLLREIACYK